MCVVRKRVSGFRVFRVLVFWYFWLSGFREGSGFRLGHSQGL